MKFVLAVEPGMNPKDALRAGTIVAAEVLGIECHAGSLVLGKHSNLIAVEGQPEIDNATLREPSIVMREGRVLFERGKS